MYFQGHRQLRDSGATFNNEKFSIFDNLYKKLASNNILIGSTDLLKAVDNDLFLYLWTELWKGNAEIERQGNYLELIFAAISDRHPQIYYSTQDFISKVLKSGLMERIVVAMPQDPHKQVSEAYMKVLNNFIKILIAAFELIPAQIGDNFMIWVRNIFYVFTNVIPVSDETTVLLQKLEENVLEFQKIEAEEEPSQQNEQPKRQKIFTFKPSHGKPSDDFRSLSIIPDAAELALGYQPFIRKAIINGPYKSDNDYLDTQFRLMREDLVQKFREGISTHETNDQDIYIHRDVTFDPSTLHYPTGDFIHYANIRVSKQVINNKIMKYKSLVCISSDNFKKDCLFAIVMDRDEKYVKEGKVGLKFEGNKFEIDINQEYSMVESSAFFEAYRHVLTTLQGFNPEKPIPFSKYFVQLNTQTQRPAYLKNENCFDFSPVLTEEAYSELLSTKFHPSDLSKLNCELFGMNESQFEAFKHALTSDLAVIQGPPGTGKSYIGSEIAKVLLNENNWKTINPDKYDQRPLLVVCYTNHALDQFLTQIAGFVDGKDIVRVGSRCKNPLIQEIMLHNRRHELNEARTSYNNLKKQIDPLLHTLSKNLEYLIQLESRLASKEAICVSENYTQIANNVLFSKLLNDEDIVKWLTTYKSTTENEYHFDIDLIRTLVEWEIPQINAKNIYSHAWNYPDGLRPYYHIVMQAEKMDENRAYDENDIWKLSLPSRWSLYQFWIFQAQKARKREIAEAENKYRHLTKLINEQKTVVDCEIMKNAKVVGMTTTCAAKFQSTLRSIKPRIVIAEEAAEVFEAHIVTSLTEACEHLILIGDHKQLRPNQAVYELAKKFNMNVSLFERLIKNKFPYKMLNFQHRMRPEISMLMKNHFYEDLHDHDTVKGYPHVRGVTKDLFFVTHSYSETTNKQDGSHKNEFEITILCTYSDQCFAMQELEEKVLGAKKGIQIETVDNFQGEESDIIIISLVRSNNNEHKIGFLNISNRKCVALSRAKIGLYVIGNMKFIATAESQNNKNIKEHQSWQDIIKSAKANENISETLVVKCQMHGKIQEIITHKDFEIKCREGGCQLICDKEMECGHKCLRYCHGKDMDHTKTKCHQPCKRHCSSNLKHTCMKECWEECGSCEIEIEKILDCDHKVIEKCHVEIDKIKCTQICDRLLECDHQCPKMCHEKCPIFCEKLIFTKLVCGHWGAKQCSDDPLKVKCTTQTKKEWPICGHAMETFCHINPEFDPCPHPCDTLLEECGHKCQGTCGSCIQGLLHKPCEHECTKQMFCGHKCKAKCFEACPPCEEYCQTACGHTSCSNVKGKKQGKVRFLNSQNDEQDTNVRKCGEACYPCLKTPCQAGCEHAQCTMKCGQDCNIELCTKHCGKPLQCSKRSKNKKIIELHPCIGVCGESKCLKLCPICDIDRVGALMKEFSLINGKPSHAFIKLDNCQHIFEVTALDKYIKTSVNYPSDIAMEIVKLKCPKCDKRIFTSRRYNSFINKQAVEIENIKTILREFNEDKNKQQQFMNEMAGLTALLRNSILTTSATYASKIDVADFSLLTDGCITVLEDCQIMDCREILKQKFNQIFDRCARIHASNQLFEQTLSETKRFGFFVDFSSDFDIEEEIDLDILKSIIKKLTNNEIFTDDHEG
uniref:NF-X1-type domain-containing protein n=1 Tax=Panagrolaimus sp. ES5 TaxID=591445 RepID=A0AC34F2L1_9BILA